jgi:hypothetical protein
MIQLTARPRARRVSICRASFVEYAKGEDAYAIAQLASRLKGAREASCPFALDVAPDGRVYGAAHVRLHAMW